MHNSIVTNQSTQSDQSPFDSIRRFDEHGNEYWLARDLMLMLGYKSWQKFNGVIETARENLETVTSNVADHINPTDNLVKRAQEGVDFFSFIQNDKRETGATLPNGTSRVLIQFFP